MRKIIQITTSPCGDTFPYLVALCDDGTVWHLLAPEEWELLSPIPQNDLDPEKSAGAIPPEGTL